MFDDHGESPAHGHRDASFVSGRILQRAFACGTQISEYIGLVSQGPSMVVVPGSSRPPRHPLMHSTDMHYASSSVQRTRLGARGWGRSVPDRENRKGRDTVLVSNELGVLGQKEGVGWRELG